MHPSTSVVFYLCRNLWTFTLSRSLIFQIRNIRHQHLASSVVISNKKVVIIQPPLTKIFHIKSLSSLSTPPARVSYPQWVLCHSLTPFSPIPHVNLQPLFSDATAIATTNSTRPLWRTIPPIPPFHTSSQIPSQFIDFFFH